MYDTASTDGALIYDMSKSGAKTSWPPEGPVALSRAKREWSTTQSGEYLGRGPVSFLTSNGDDAEWSSWLSYAKTDLLAVTHVGEGTLLPQSSTHYYAIMLFSDIGNSVDEVRNIMLKAVTQAGKACVGFHLHEGQFWPHYLRAALLYDADVLGSWPVPVELVPAALSHATVEGSSNNPKGTGPVSYTASLEAGRGWATGWQSYAKFESMYDLGGLQYIGEGTLVSQTNGPYFTMKGFSNIADTEQNLWIIMRRALLQCGRCVGYHYQPSDDSGTYLRATLLYHYNGFTPGTPGALQHASRLFDYGGSWPWNGQRPVSDKASEASDLNVPDAYTYNGWYSYGFLTSSDEQSDTDN